MMLLKVDRIQRDADVTIGRMLVNGVFECWTLEDAVREKPGRPVSEWKIARETAIPIGRYQVIVNQSARFKRMLPLLVNVPGYTGVRIHPGNTAANTDGCILLGDVRLQKSIGQSRLAFDRVFSLINTALVSGEFVHVEIA